MALSLAGTERVLVAEEVSFEEVPVENTITAAASSSQETIVSGSVDALVSGEIVCIRRYEGPYYPDSIEYGTPSKGGAIKVFGNLDDTTTFETRLRAAMALRDLAQDLANPEV
jgi:hypothetical protein